MPIREIHNTTARLNQEISKSKIVWPEVSFNFINLYTIGASWKWHK